MVLTRSKAQKLTTFFIKFQLILPSVISRSQQLKVHGAKWKVIYKFLTVYNCNYRPVWHHYWDIGNNCFVSMVKYVKMFSFLLWPFSVFISKIIRDDVKDDLVFTWGLWCKKWMNNSSFFLKITLLTSLDKKSFGWEVNEWSQSAKKFAFIWVLIRSL